MAGLGIETGIRRLRPALPARHNGDVMSSPGSAVRVVLVEDDPDVREGLAGILGVAPRVQYVGDFATGEAAAAALPSLEVDVVLMDIQLPGMSGIECIRRIKELRPAVQILMLTVFEDHDRIFESLAAGATGYLLKQTPPDRLIEAIREVQRGGAPMSAPIARRVVEAFRRPAPAPATPSLSPREKEILALLARGQLYKEIADHLSLSVETVRTHLRNIYDKLQVRSRTEAVMKVYGRLPGPAT